MIFLVIILLLIDQVTKLIVALKLQINQSITIIPRHLKITSIRNKGATNGILEGERSLLIIISLIATFIFSYLLITEKSSTIALIFIVSGTVGNLIDRIFRGEVIDFIAIKCFNYEFPIFNFADFYLLLGMIIFLFYEII